MKVPLRVGMLMLVLVILLVLVSGCNERVQSVADPVSEVTAEAGDPFRPITLKEALAEVDEVLTSGEQPPEYIPVYYIQGRAVSTEGKAEQWIIGVRYENDDYFVLVESNRVVLMPGQKNLPETVINTAIMIEPGALVSINSQLISQTFNIPETSLLVDLELSENIYAMTPEGPDAYRILYFEAITGKPIH